MERLAGPFSTTGRGRPGAQGQGAATPSAGEPQEGPWQRSLQYRGTYPSGWTSMQLLAAYDADGQAGLYVGMHDPLGSTKDVIAESRPAERTVTLAFEHPAANMGTGGNGFELSGEAVWQFLHGELVRRRRDLPRLGSPRPAGIPGSGLTAVPTRPCGCGSYRFGLRPAGAQVSVPPESRSSRNSSACRLASTGTRGTRSPSTTITRTTSRPSRGSPRRSATSRRRACT